MTDPIALITFIDALLAEADCEQKHGIHLCDVLREIRRHLESNLTPEPQPPMELVEQVVKAMANAPASRIVTFQEVTQKGGDEPFISAKTTEYRITDESRAQAALSVILRELDGVEKILNDLARLGNGPHLGNSIGNTMAQEALSKLAQLRGK